MVKKMCLIGVCAIMITGGGGYAAENRRIETGGTAKVWVTPDSARLFLGIESLHADAGKAREENAVRMQKLLSALKNLRIKDIRVKAPSYQVELVKEREYDAVREGRVPRIIGYRIVQEFTVRIQDRDPDRLSQNAAKILDTALAHGVNLVRKVKFFKEDDTSQRREAVKLAVQDAMKTAQVMARAAGVRIKEYVTITTGVRYFSPPQPLMTQRVDVAAAAGPQTSSTLSAGRIVLSAQARISCEIK
ncbi:MAG: DUF541 domain-containing protein [Candidatus Omnitrophica bacterium]|nr:DUF541 domain-containing protein [Candidatus Omnitrophota bacterium]